MSDRQAQQDAVIERIVHRESIEARDRLTPRMEAEQILIALDCLSRDSAPSEGDAEGVVQFARRQIDAQRQAEEAATSPQAVGAARGQRTAYHRVIDFIQTRAAAPVVDRDERSSGVAAIKAERERQIRIAYSRDHDLLHSDGELVTAALHYLRRSPWPANWSDTALQRREGGPGQPATVRDLTKAGALIAAEIDRLSAPVPEGAARPEEDSEARRRRGVCACGLHFGSWVRCGTCGEANPFYEWVDARPTRPEDQTEGK